MTQFSRYVQNAIDLGIMEVQDGKIVSCDKDAIDTVLGVARVVEKIQPDLVEEEEGCHRRPLRGNAGNNRRGAALAR